MSQIQIQRLHLRLPARFAGSAPELARVVGRGLGQLDGAESTQRTSLQVPCIVAAPEASQGEVAGRIVRAIGTQLRRASRAGGGGV